MVNMCESLHYESVYFKELHNEQEYYWPTIYRAGAAVVWTITSYIVIESDRGSKTSTIRQVSGKLIITEKTELTN